jgi:hypothetical protein
MIKIIKERGNKFINYFRIKCSTVGGDHKKCFEILKNEWPYFSLARSTVAYWATGDSHSLFILYDTEYN